MLESLRGARIGFAVCGSFCTFEKAFASARELISLGCELTPIMSFNAASLNTRFGKASEHRSLFEGISGRPLIATIEDAEPIGPKKPFDLMIVAPCTGNTLAKLALAITDTPVTMAVKAHMRNQRPTLIALATNDALSGSAKNLGMLQNVRGYFFVPFEQDDPAGKPASLVSLFDRLPEAAALALQGKQLQPMYGGGAL